MCLLPSKPCKPCFSLLSGLFSHSPVFLKIYILWFVTRLYIFSFCIFIHYSCIFIHLIHYNTFLYSILRTNVVLPFTYFFCIVLCIHLFRIFVFVFLPNVRYLSFVFVRVLIACCFLSTNFYRLVARFSVLLAYYNPSIFYHYFRPVFVGKNCYVAFFHHLFNL